MGVPAFYRWLSEKYPKIVSDVLEQRPYMLEGHPLCLPDAREKNPSDLECDNFYIDLNGIIHPCSHPESGPQPQSHREMYENVGKYVDRLFNVVRPRKLLFIAIDGVAPRAKMNQQRSRRFRSAQEATEHAETAEQLFRDLTKQGILPPDAVRPKASSQFDSNVITPGTKFMYDLSQYLQQYICDKIATVPAWQDIKVFFSDASIPGEGEHKIMQYIRCQRAQPGYNPNLVHTIHGLDADLIMLALATHELHFYILREEVLFGRRGAEISQRRKAQSGFEDAQKALDEKSGCSNGILPPEYTKALQRLSVPVLREYLMFEFEGLKKNLPYKFDFERIIDDVVFFSFFVGNDFLPHLPSLDIRDGALDFLFNVYKRLLPTLPVPYLTSEGGAVNLSCVDIILAEVGHIESHVFQLRNEKEEQEKRRREMQIKRSLENKGTAAQKSRQDGTILKNHLMREEQKTRVVGKAARVLSSDTDGPASKKVKVEENLAAAAKLKAELRGSVEEVKVKVEDNNSSVNNNVKAEVDDHDAREELDEKERYSEEKNSEIFKEALKTAERDRLDEIAKTVVDTVKLHEAGYKERYYSDKCKAEDIEGLGREHLFRSYVTGLCWIMQYYYRGVPSWKWYFPFHYAPFASDLRNIDRFQSQVDFRLNEPFAPVEQLLSVLPASSAHALPKCLQPLMLNPDSPIIDFYPENVPVDPNGKAMPWLWVVLLPFIDESRLLSATKGTLENFTDVEKRVASIGVDEGKLYFSHKHQLKDALTVNKSKDKSCDLPPLKPLGDASRWDGFTGFIRETNEFSNEKDQITNCVSFKNPRCTKHRSVILRGTKIPKTSLIDSDRNIIRPRLNRGQNIAYMGVSPFGVAQQPPRSLQNQNNQHRVFQQNFNPFLQRPPQGQHMQTSVRPYGIPPPPPPPPPGHRGIHQFNYAGQSHNQAPQQQRNGFSFASSSNYNYANARQLQPPPPAQQQRIQQLRDELRKTLAAQNRNGQGQSNSKRR